MSEIKHPDPADKDWREQLRIAADEDQQRRETVIKKRIAESMALRRVGDQRIADQIVSKDIN